MIYISYTFTMPGIGSWDGKWTGENNKYINVRGYSVNDPRITRILSSSDYEYDFKDGWRARIIVEKINAKEKNRRMLFSSGFCGYEWMINSIEKNGKIILDR